MQKAVLIFDCDGTLIDSYDAIVERIQRVFLAKNLNFPLDEIKHEVLMESAVFFIEKICKEYELNRDEIFEIYKNTDEKNDLVELMPNAKNMLEKLRENGYKLFVYTHRGKSVFSIFERLGIENYFEEIIDASKGFPRKPKSEAIEYLISKYNIDRNNAYYVGDRMVDLECAENAKIKSIFYQSSGLNIDTKKASFVIKDLLEINDIFK